MTDTNNEKKEEFWLKLGNCTEVIEIASTPARLYILIANIQLALRHSDNTGASAEIARDIALNMTEAVCHHVPEARESIEMGWNPSYDITDAYFREEFVCDAPSYNNGALKYNNGVPIHWKYLQWPGLAKSIEAYFQPYASPSVSPLPELNEQELYILKRYLSYYVEAPAWRINETTTQAYLNYLNSLSEAAASLSNRSEISVFLAQCLQVGFDPM